MKQLDDVIKRFINDSVSKLHTVTIGRVVKVSTKTIDVQPVINLIYNGEDLELPVLAEVPPVFMQGGGSYTAHPIAVGDYALVIFTERAYDRWYEGVDGVRPPELRMHDYSDGFAIVGINPLSGAIDIPSVITQIGDAYQSGNYEHIGNVMQTGDNNQTGDYILNGNLTFNTVETSGQSGVSGTFQSNDLKTITVTNGIITGIA